MRFRTLGLDRYGPFTDRVLEFDPDASVTIIQGANETGKTTALAAVSEALFGIEERSRYNFLHEYRMMRLSATVIAPDGRALSFARLKRRVSTLVDPRDDTPLSDDCLASFLGAHDRRAFLDIFGLDQTRLRDGGRKLLAGGGDLANTLLAAAPGLGHVVALRDHHKQKAAEIFNPGRRNTSHAFYSALDKRSHAQRAIRERELRVDEVKKLREEAERAAEAREQAVKAEIEARLGRAHAQSLGRAAKELRTLDALAAAREALGPLPQVPRGFVLRARELLGRLEKARTAVAQATEEEAKALLAVNSVDVDDTFPPLAEQIESCDGERAAIQKELLSLPNRRNEETEARAGLARIAAGLGLPNVETLRERMPGPPLLARADKLVDRLGAAAVRSETLTTDRTKLAANRRAAEEARADLGHVADPAPAKRCLVLLDGAEERERALRVLDHRLVSARQELTERVSRLGIGVPDIEALATLPLPDLSAAEAALRDVRNAYDTLKRQKEAQAGLEEQLAQIEVRLEALNAGRPAPTEAAIDITRRERDGLWATLRPLALRHRVPTEDDSPTALRLDHAIVAADLLADERQTETKRLAELAQAELEIADIKVRIDMAIKRVSDAKDRVDEAGTAWLSLWAASSNTPPADERAIALLREAEAIRQARDTVRKDGAEGENAREAVRWDREKNSKLRHQLGLPPLGDAPLRIVDIRDAIAELESRFLQARNHEHDLKQLNQTASEIENREREITRESEALAVEAAYIFPLLMIRAEARIEEVRAALDLWREALALVADLGTAERRVTGIERDEKAFIMRVNELLQRAGTTPTDDDAFSAAKHLRAKLDAARLARSRVDAAIAALDDRRKTLASAQSAQDRVDADMAMILSAAGTESSEELPLLLDRLDDGADCDKGIAAARLRLDDIRGSLSVAEIRAAVAGKDDNALARLVAEAEAEHERASSARDTAIERDTQTKSALEALQQREGAAIAAQEEQDAVAAIAEAVERFTREHVAARMLTAAIERYREQHQNPIVERASRAFAALTNGRWSGIGIDYDADAPRLAPMRDGRLFGIDALSEGTADQLYLAFRVAAIEEHARRATPLPFIADDLFVSFDEARTEAGLALLSELGKLTQVIVFTHHDHVATCATRALKQAATIIQL